MIILWSLETVLQPKLALLESLPQLIQSMSTALQENQSKSHESLSRIFQTFADRLLLSQVALLKETITTGARERDEYREQEMQRAETKQVVSCTAAMRRLLIFHSHSFLLPLDVLSFPIVRRMNSQRLRLI